VDPGLSTDDERVETHMTKAPECIRPYDAIAYALNLMAIGGFRHVPITDSNKALQGIVSIRDIARLITETFKEEILNLPAPRRKGPTTQHGG
jgi:CBS domain-containing protein